jgi:hypothetical protein
LAHRAAPRLDSRVVADDEMQAHELKTQRVDAFDDPVECGLVHELSVKKRHPGFGSELELWKCGLERRSRFAAELELKSFSQTVDLLDPELGD